MKKTKTSYLLILCLLVFALTCCGTQAPFVTDPSDPTPGTTAEASAPDTTAEIPPPDTTAAAPARWELRADDITTVMGLNVLTSERTPIDTVQRNGSTRSESFIALMEDCMPDSIGLCEVTAQWLDYIEEEVCTRLPYAVAGLTSNSGKPLTVSTGEYNAIVYRSDRYEVIAQGGYWLSSTPDVPSKYSSAAGDFAEDCVGMSLVRAFCYVVLGDLSTGEPAYIHMNTHFDHKSGPEADLLCARQLIACAYSLREEYNCPVIMSGDFNDDEDDAAYLYLADAANGYVNAKYQTEHYSPLTTAGGHGTGYKKSFRHVIDHIFISARSATVVQHDVIVSPYMSDHSPVYVELILP